MCYDASMSETKHDRERLSEAAERVADFGASEHRRGFQEALQLAELALRWMLTNRVMSKALAKEMRLACEAAGVEAPVAVLRAEGEEWEGLDLTPRRVR
jgi:hypothetical protein